MLADIIPLSLFYCYAREDQALRDELDTHLTGLRRSGRIVCWYDGELVPGELWEKTIEHHLETADIILLLITPDFIKSDYCYSKEMVRAIERHNAGTTCVVPILMRPVDWSDAPFADIQVLPSNARAIASSGWFNRDEAFEDVARGLRRTISELVAKRTNDLSLSIQLQSSENAEKKLFTPSLEYVQPIPAEQKKIQLSSTQISPKALEIPVVSPTSHRPHRNSLSVVSSSAFKKPPAPLRLTARNSRKTSSEPSIEPLFHSDKSAMPPIRHIEYEDELEVFEDFPQTLNSQVPPLPYRQEGYDVTQNLRRSQKSLGEEADTLVGSGPNYIDLSSSRLPIASIPSNDAYISEFPVSSRRRFDIAALANVKIVSGSTVDSRQRKSIIGGILKKNKAFFDILILMIPWVIFISVIIIMINVGSKSPELLPISVGTSVSINEEPTETAIPVTQTTETLHTTNLVRHITTPVQNKEAFDSSVVWLWLLVGLLLGFLANWLDLGGGFGVLSDIVGGCLGGLIGGFLANWLGFFTGWLGTSFIALIGAGMCIAMISIFYNFRLSSS